jgi:uncharacterized 2Fe-2S/4Fe-4S cluster protein (DUF4445 family)
MQSELKVVFQPSGRTVHVMPSTTVFEAGARAGLLLRAPCGGKGTCKKCRVQITRGAGEPSGACRASFSADELAKGWRLACQTSVDENLIVVVPEDSLFEAASKILTTDTGEAVQGTPAVRKQFLTLPPPVDTDPVADLARIDRETGALKAPLSVLRRLPDLLRESKFACTVTVAGSHLLDVEPGDTTAARPLGVAFDIGTTTLVGTLLCLQSQRELAVAATINPQVSFGDDVISRITLAREGDGHVEELRHLVTEACNGLIAELIEEAGATIQQVLAIAVAGNTTMQHLFCGLSPAALGEVPFSPVYSRALEIPASELGLQGHPLAQTYIFPNIGGFVGGDTVSGMLAHRLAEIESPTLFVDIGTNGEIVLAGNGQILASSAAAGPAFEGARITCGMRATDGAIEKIVIDDAVHCNVIGNAKASGLCGTALIDGIADLLRLGAIDETGRILGPNEAPDAISAEVRDRLVAVNGDFAFELVSAEQSKTGEAIRLYQRDVRELQLASGAIRAGISIMLRKAGLSPDDLDSVLLAGGFGNYIRRENAQRIGLLPDLPVERIRFVGNAASTGAKAVLFARELREKAEHIARVTEHVDLSMDPDFQMEFGMAMMFPGETSMLMQMM